MRIITVERLTGKFKVTGKAPGALAGQLWAVLTQAGEALLICLPSRTVVCAHIVSFRVISVAVG